MQPGYPPSPDTGPSPSGALRVVLSVVVTAVVAVLVFVVLTAAFGKTTASTAPAFDAAPTTSATTSGGAGGGVIADPVVVKSAINDAGEIETVKVSLKLGDELRAKVVPSDTSVDPVIGLAVPEQSLSMDYFREGFTGNATELFKGPYKTLYGDTDPPVTIIPIVAIDATPKGGGEWLVFVAPTAAEYTVIVRGRGDTQGSYVLTTQTKSASKAVRPVERLRGRDDWIDLQATQGRVEADVAYFTDRAFFGAAEFTDTGNNYQGPTEAAIKARFVSR